MITFTLWKKAEIINKGISLDLYKESVMQINSRVTACNGLFLKYSERNQETYIKTKINPKSRYFLVNRDKKLQLIDEKGLLFLNNINILTSNIKSNIFTEQLSGIIATSLYGCQLVNLGLQCKFCSSQEYGGIKFSKKDFKSELEKIVLNKDINGITINGGSFPKLRYKGYELMSNYIKIVKEIGIKEINIELMPNPRIKEKEIGKFFEQIKKEGVTSAQFNLEIWNKNKRKKLMPYKGFIPIQTYLNYLQMGSNFLGKGKVSSVLLVGLNNSKEIIEGSKEILNNGGIPSLEIFRPLPNTPLENFQTDYELEDILKISQEVKKEIDLKFENKRIFEGCLKCGGCGLNKDLKQIKPLGVKIK